MKLKAKTFLEKTWDRNRTIELEQKIRSMHEWTSILSEMYGQIITRLLGKMYKLEEFSDYSLLYAILFLSV